MNHKLELGYLVLEVPDPGVLDAVFGDVVGLIAGSELGIPSELGRHDNDGMFSFYLQSLAGFQIEVGHGARVITEGWTDNRAYDAISVWGHQPLRQA